MEKQINTGVTWITPNQQERATRFAENLALPLVGPRDRNHRFLLEFTDHHLQLRDTSAHGPGPVHVEFGGGKNDYRRRQGGGLQQTLARAIGIKGGYNLTVIDATAGLGRDGFVMATLGCRVIMYERSPIVHALLADGLARGRLQPEITAIITRMELIRGSIKPGPDRAEVVYLDPMYPHRRKSALVKKEMRFLRAIAGDDADAPALLEQARRIADKRVVVKRPKSAPPLGEEKSDFSISSKNTRYDIYVR